LNSEQNLSEIQSKERVKLGRIPKERQTLFQLRQSVPLQENNRFFLGKRKLFGFFVITINFCLFDIFCCKSKEEKKFANIKILRDGK